MVSRIFKVAATTVATLSLASAASAGCGSSLYCGNSGASMSSVSSYGAGSYNTGISSYGSGSYNTGSSYSLDGMSSYGPSTSYTTTMSSTQADATYGTGSISESYASDASYGMNSFGPNTYGFSGSTHSVAGLGVNESLQTTNCPTNVYGAGEGTVLGCYNVVKPVPQTTYHRVVRPVIYVRYPVPVAVPYTSPCHTVKHYSRYGNYHTGGFRPRCG